MKLAEIQKKTEKLVIINKSLLRNFEKNSDALDYNIKYWIKSGDLIALKNGVYVFAERYKNEKNKDGFLEYLAGQLVSPSYLSLEFVMAKHQLLTESVNAITSVTTKSTRSYNNKLGAFRYYSVTPKLFCSYQIDSIGGASVATASKAKAVFDFLYLRITKDLTANEKEIEELRINWENLSKKEYKELASYTEFTRNVKIKEAIKLIQKMYF